MEFLKAAGRQTLIGLVSLASVVTLFSYFGNYDPPVSILRAHASMAPVYPAGKLVIQWEMERTRRCYAEFDRYIVDAKGRRIELANIVKEGGYPIASRDPFTTEVMMPEDMPPGPSKYISTGLYSCNLWQKFKPIMVPAPEVDFDVLPRQAKQGGVWSGPFADRG